MIHFVNLTPHDIVVQRDDGVRVTFAATGKVARVAVTREDVKSRTGYRITRQIFGQVEGLPCGPDVDRDAIYIVSALVLSALGKDCYGVVAPDTGPDAIRVNGQIVAVRGFVTND